MPVMMVGCALCLNVGSISADDGDSSGPDKRQMEEAGKNTCLEEWNLMVSFVGFTINYTSKQEIDGNERLRFFLLDECGKVLSWRNALLKAGVAKEKLKINEKCFVWIEDFFRQNDLGREYHEKYGL